MGFFDKIKEGLAKTRDALSDSLGSVFRAFPKLTTISMTNWRRA